MRRLSPGADRAVLTELHRTRLLRGREGWITRLEFRPTIALPGNNAIEPSTGTALMGAIEGEATMKRKSLRSAMWGRSILTLCALVVCAGMAFAGPRKLSRDLEGHIATDQVDIIVQF